MWRVVPDDAAVVCKLSWGSLDYVHTVDVMLRDG